MSTSEREHPRYAHEAAVTLRVRGKTFEGHTRNVSRGGLCADLGDQVPIGIDIEVDLALVFDEATQSEPLRLPARIVWCTGLGDAFQVGLAFKPLDAQQAEYLTLFLSYLDDSRVEKRPRDLSIDDRFR